MGKELIRNGGFETGDDSFWFMSEYGELTIQSVEKHLGVYAAEVVGTTANLYYLFSKDYHAVVANELYKAIAWLKGGKAGDVQKFGFHFYDSSFGHVTTKYGDTLISPAIWTKLTEYIIVPEEASYIYISIIGTATEEEMIYFDSFSLQRIETDKNSVLKEELIKVINETTKHTVTGDEFFTGIWKEAEYFFDLTSFTETLGANPVTIDVKIESYDPETETWRDAMVFQQKSCPASGSVTTQEYKRLVGGLGWKQRVSYTTAGAGTIGDCDFKVGVVYKR